MNLEQLIVFFNNSKLTDKPIKLNEATTIINQKKFVKSHIRFLIGNKGNKAFRPYYNRLIQLYKILKTK